MKRRGKQESISKYSRGEISIDFIATGEIKKQFSNKSLFKYLANDILILFSIFNLCEIRFSTEADMKLKYRPQLNIEKQLRMSISNIRLFFEKLCSTDRSRGMADNS